MHNEIIHALIASLIIGLFFAAYGTRCLYRTGQLKEATRGSAFWYSVRMLIIAIVWPAFVCKSIKTMVVSKTWK
jgi:Na+/H+-dicarboxylate symporter